MSSGSIQSDGVREAKQARSRETRDKLISALDSLLKEKSFAEIGVAEIAGRAGCAVGSVYRRFENKDAFVPVLLEVTAQRMADRMREMGPLRLSREGDLKGDLEQVAQRAWTVLSGESHLLRLAHQQARMENPVCDTAMPALMDGVRQAIEAALRQRAGDRAEAERKRAARWATYFLITPLMEKALYPDRSPASFLQTSGEEIGREMAALIALRLG